MPSVRTPAEYALYWLAINHPDVMERARTESSGMLCENTAAYELMRAVLPVEIKVQDPSKRPQIETRLVEAMPSAHAFRGAIKAATKALEDLGFTVIEVHYRTNPDREGKTLYSALLVGESRPPRAKLGHILHDDPTLC